MLTSKLVPLVTRNVQQTRNVHYVYGSVICTPPTQKISFMEKMATAAIFGITYLAYPMYFFANINYYKGGSKEE